MGIPLSRIRSQLDRSDTKSRRSGGSGNSQKGGKFSPNSSGRRTANEPDTEHPIPAPLMEIDRLDVEHYLLQTARINKFYAPLDHPRRIIDVGTGSGIWMLEMAAEFPDCEFLGIDIIPIQPTTTLPLNCQFEVANALRGIPRPDGYFDYVYSRLLVAAIPKESWELYVSECVRVCASGGWVEMVECDTRMYNSGVAGERLTEYMSVSLNAMGINPGTVLELDRYMREAGLVDVHVKECALPMGRWSVPAGDLAWRNSKPVYKSLAPIYMKETGATQEEVDKIIDDAEEAFNKYQNYTGIRIAYGRKR
ncbi:S-adenosyl-L-methionine-dependent methyltransferase [Thamnocephalis sphaerospora]|uniref:S-adenosyl-L-methionine-dependent methyltransferase n=1 Tax=Thamnocephalis sphaerospora TaxID=78915 RepID=A0A4P9XNN2_9FUNG|nr:S-adenosyl-L-methionine-dependent methyltransferase [Thamnocephalis sphaerospora]|eukprot:RKP07593.1 S-adenosyl-L-methionine-dependent methyltransferase [Thamnocephalis sphaerospora]